MLIKRRYIFNTDNYEWKTIIVDVPEERIYSDFQLQATVVGNHIWVFEPKG